MSIGGNVGGGILVDMEGTTSVGVRIGVGVDITSGREKCCFFPISNKYVTVMPTPSRTKITTISIFSHVGLKNSILLLLP